MRTNSPRRIGAAALGLAVLLGLLAPLGGCATAPHPVANGDWSHFGATYRDHGRTVSLDQVSGGERDVVLDGTIHEVCLKMGCWIVLEDDGAERIFIRMRGHVWFVPRNAAGHRAVVRGDMVRRVVSVDLLRHFAEDAGRSPEEIAAITEPETRLEMVADAVWIEGDGLEPPVRQ